MAADWRDRLPAIVAASRAAQGLPPVITDPKVLAVIAALMADRRRAP